MIVGEMTDLRKMLAGITRDDAKQQRSVPLKVMIPGIGKVSFLKLLRVVPSRRITYLGQSDGMRLVVKLFYARWGSHRHWRRSERGCREFIERGVPSPGILFSGYLPQQGVHALVFEYLGDGSTLDNVVGNTGKPGRDVLLHALMAVIARHHECGIVQDDLHLGNFMVKEGNIYSLDGDHVKSRHHPVGRMPSMRNLAQLLANHPAFFGSDADSWIRAYATRRGWEFSDGEMEEIKDEILRTRKRKVSHHLRKMYRKWRPVGTSQPEGKSFLLRNLQDTEEDLSTISEAWERSFREGRPASGYSMISVLGKKMPVWSTTCSGPLFLRRFWPATKVLMDSFRLRSLDIESPQPMALVGRRSGVLRWDCSILFKPFEGGPLKDLIDSVPDQDKADLAGKLADACAVLSSMGITVKHLSPDEIFVSDKNVVFPGHTLLGVSLFRGRTETLRSIRFFLSQWSDKPDIKKVFRDQFKKRGLIE
jgi:tRNA A-37 threonylcarbamoyl transferase component Bud32